MGEFFSTRKSGEVAVMTMQKEEITMYEIDKVKKEFSEVLEKESKNLLVDFKKLNFISSLVLAALVFVNKKVREKNGKLKFCELKDKVKEMFEITDLDKVFETYPTENEAFAKFKEEGIKT